VISYDEHTVLTCRPRQLHGMNSKDLGVSNGVWIDGFTMWSYNLVESKDDTGILIEINKLFRSKGISRQD